MQTHNKQLLNVNWVTKKTRILVQAMYKCSHCGKSNVQLEVHHLYYVYGKDVWEYPDKALIVLCRNCHQNWHDTYKVEYRWRVWCKNKEYSPPTRKRQKNSKRCIRYPIGLLTPIEKRKAKIRKKHKLSCFSPIPEWRQKQRVP